MQSGSHSVPSQWEAAACLAMQESGAKQALCSLLESHTHTSTSHNLEHDPSSLGCTHLCVFLCVRAREHVQNRWERGEREKVNVFKSVPDRFSHHLLYPSVYVFLSMICARRHTGL